MNTFDDLEFVQPELFTEDTKPAPSGRVWQIIFCTDSNYLYQSDGVQWLEWPAAGEAILGEVIIWPGAIDSPPNGWAKLDGQTVLEANFKRIAAFAKLNGWFSDGGTPGNMVFPQAAGRMIRGYDPDGTVDPNVAGRTKLGTGYMFSTQEDAFALHSHSYTNPNGKDGNNGDNDDISVGDNQTSQTSGGTGFSETRDINFGLNLLIKI